MRDVTVAERLAPRALPSWPLPRSHPPARSPRAASSAGSHCATSLRLEWAHTPAVMHGARLRADQGGRGPDPDVLVTREACSGDYANDLASGSGAARRGRCPARLLIWSGVGRRKRGRTATVWAG